MSDEDLDTTDFAPTSLEVAEAEAKSDARLDETVRRAAAEAYSKPEQPLPTPHGRTLDQTISDTMARISARPESPSMPRLPQGATVDEVVEEAAKWNSASKADQRAISNAHKELAAIKEAAASYDIKISSMADVKAFREMMAGKDAKSGAPALDSDLSEALAPGQPDKALPVLRETVQAIQRDPVSGTRQLLDNMGVHPLHLLSPQEQQALAGSHGGEVGSVLARYSDVFSRNGVSPAQGVRLLLEAQHLLETDPQRAIGMLSQAYGVPHAEGEQAMGPIVEAWGATKGQSLTPQVRQLMADIVQEKGFSGEDVPLLNVLNAAFMKARRRISQHAKRDPSKRLEDSVDAAAAKVYGRR